VFVRSKKGKNNHHNLSVGTGGVEFRCKWRYCIALKELVGRTSASQSQTLRGLGNGLEWVWGSVVNQVGGSRARKGVDGGLR